MFDLKPLRREAIPAALEKAERYRLLNEPQEAESICLDVLAVDAKNQQAIVMLLLALSDQFEGRLGAAFEQARKLLERLPDEYSRTYYEGLLCERRAKAHHKQGNPSAGNVAFEWFRRAMECYERAERIRPAGNDDPILRWNTCARLLERHPELVAALPDTGEPFLE